MGLKLNLRFARFLAGAATFFATFTEEVFAAFFAAAHLLR
jgi:hypothetical protein